MSKFSLVLASLNHFLDVKNERYGDSALSPLHIFNKEGEMGIEQRIDDKLSRIKNSKELRKNDVVDLAGYLILLCLRQGWENFDELLD
jgi:hypothetical protein